MPSSLRGLTARPEGQITKLELIRRHMYGRTKIDLLQARLIGAA
jgi:transposase